MSTALSALRREIGIRTGQPFFIKFSGTFEDASATGTTTTLIDTTALLEADNFWRGQYIYLPGTRETREISAFDNGTSQLTWLAPIAASTAAGDDYEIWSTFSPIQVQRAINSAIRDAWPFFFDVGSARLALLEGVIPRYTLPTDDTIRRMQKVILPLYDSVAGTTTATASADNRLTDDTKTFTSADNDKLVVIYTGTDASGGDIRTVGLGTGNDLVTTTDFTATIGADVKYRLIDLNTQEPTVYILDNYKLDGPTFPTQIWLGESGTGYEGHFLRLEYEMAFSELDLDSNTTDCPTEYVILTAMANLYLQKLSLAPATEVRAWAEMQKATATAAQQFVIRHRFHRESSTITRWSPDRSYGMDYPFIE